MKLKCNFDILFFCSSCNFIESFTTSFQYSSFASDDASLPAHTRIIGAFKAFADFSTFFVNRSALQLYSIKRMQLLLNQLVRSVFELSARWYLHVEHACPHPILYRQVLLLRITTSSAVICLKVTEQDQYIIVSPHRFP